MIALYSMLLHMQGVSGNRKINIGLVKMIVQRVLPKDTRFSSTSAATSSVKILANIFPFQNSWSNYIHFIG